jgi:hypothetical protein
MTILLVLLGLLFILIILRLFTTVKEGFVSSQPSLSPTTTKAYTSFLEFYNSFCTNWQKAITSSVASELPQQPLTDPSQVQSSTAPNIPTTQLNQYITQLEQELSQPLPQICVEFPTSIDTTSIGKVISQMPTDVQPYINALNWMNQQMSQAHQNLGNALSGNSVSATKSGTTISDNISGNKSSNTKESFEDMCQDVSQCIANNPELAQQISQQIAEQNKQSVAQQEEQLMTLINPFLTNEDLKTANELNQQLVQKSQDVQNQAQSGELMNQVNVPEGTPVLPMVKPANSDTLSQMANSNPQRYNELKNNYSQLFSLKQTLESINGAF